MRRLGIFKIKLEKKFPIPLISITPEMKGVKSVRYFMGQEIDFKHSQIDLKDQPVAVISYFSEGTDTIYVYKDDEWQLIGSKKLFR